MFDWKTSYLEYLIWVWQIVLFMEEIYQLSKIAGVSFGEKVTMYVDSYWNKIDIIGCVSMIAAMALRLLGAHCEYPDFYPFLQFLYLFLLVFAEFRNIILN